MKYNESQKDKKLRNKFVNSYEYAFLRGINLAEGELRGINSLNLDFDYPIVAIAGKNGAGKSTILALACCGYHNSKSGYKLPKRKNAYYTFSDFFVQHTEEVPPQGISIGYKFAHNKWRKSEQFPEGKGLGWQRRRKKKAGKWNDYADRIHRNVVFLGIERVVPHVERSQSRSYSKSFKDAEVKGWENDVKDIVGSILGRTYKKLRYLVYSKYSLPIVQVGETIYSGLNMGAGENALFEIFSTIYSAGQGALLVIDEVELGLHAEAQRRFIDKLKDVCLETNTQVICTTHSREIFDCLPYDARFFVESINGKTKITESISSDFAFAKLSAISGQELDLLVEDDVAEAILRAVLPAKIRNRLTIKVIGSASALSRQLAAIYVRGEGKPVLSIFDGDQRKKESDNLTHAKKMAENVTEDFGAWFESKVLYLPGDLWPESWLLEKSHECISSLAEATKSDADGLSDLLHQAKHAGKHNEFYELSSKLGLERVVCLNQFASCVSANFATEFEEIILKIEDVLNNT